MKVRVIKRETVLLFAEKHAGAVPSFAKWIKDVKDANWNIPENIKSTFGSADLLGNGSNRVVLDIGGNNYRIICKYVITRTEFVLYVKWIGTHAEYTKLCNRKGQYTVNDH